MTTTVRTSWRSWACVATLTLTALVACTGPATEPETPDPAGASDTDATTPTPSSTPSSTASTSATPGTETDAGTESESVTPAPSISTAAAGSGDEVACSLTGLPEGMWLAEPLGEYMGGVETTSWNVVRDEDVAQEISIGFAFDAVPDGLPTSILVHNRGSLYSSAQSFVEMASDPDVQDFSPGLARSELSAPGWAWAAEELNPGTDDYPDQTGLYFAAGPGDDDDGSPTWRRGLGVHVMDIEGEPDLDAALEFVDTVKDLLCSS